MENPIKFMFFMLQPVKSHWKHCGKKKKKQPFLVASGEPRPVRLEFQGKVRVFSCPSAVSVCVDLWYPDTLMDDQWWFMMICDLMSASDL